MKKQINLSSNTINYTLKVNKRTRRMKLAIYGSGNMVVTIPRGVSQNFVEKVMHEKKEWILGALSRVRASFTKVLSEETKETKKSARIRAASLVEKRLEYWNQLYGFTFNKVTIRDQKTRWGSCSKQKNLSFNYRITHLPQELSDYIVVHELCHCEELNHSKRFWTLVEKALPEYRKLKKELRKNYIRYS